MTKEQTAEELVGLAGTDEEAEEPEEKQKAKELVKGLPTDFTMPELAFEDMFDSSLLPNIDTN